MSDNFCHVHNLVNDEHIDAEKTFGIRIGIPASDPFGKLVGPQWQAEHWFASVEKRDTAYREMAKRHGYYRIGDNPSQVLEKVTR